MNLLSAMARATQMIADLQRALSRPGTPPSHLADRMAELHGRRIALATPEGPRTFEELARMARRAAGALRARGVRPGTRVLLVGEGARALAWALGSWRLAATLICAPEGRAGVEALLADAEAEPEGPEDTSPPAEAPDSAPAAIAWSAGGEAARLAWSTAHRWWTPGLTVCAPEGTRVVVALPLASAEGLGAALGALAAGATVDPLPRSALAAAIAADRPKVIAVAPADVREAAPLFAEYGGRVVLALGAGATEACRAASASAKGPRMLVAIEQVVPRLAVRVWHTALGRLGKSGLPVPV